MTQVFLLKANTSPWTLPSDWFDAGHTINLIGAGGNGGAGTTGTSAVGSGGGGGGGHLLLTFSAGTLGTPGVSTVPFHVPAGGAGTGTANGTIWLSINGSTGYYGICGSGGNASGVTAGASSGTGSLNGSASTITYTSS